MAEKKEDEPKGQTLAAYLFNVRAAKRMTLREVEEATERAVSNAYLSQLEHGRISKPSPNILHSLTEVYAIPYDVLMEKAGYITASSDRKEGAQHGRVATFANENLTSIEEEELLKYLAFLRSRGGGMK